MNVTALSTSAPLRHMIDGPLRDGVAIGRRHIAFDRYVISLTPPGGAKMPNGIEVEVEATAGQRAQMGSGRLILDGSVIAPGLAWDAVPRVGVAAGSAQAATGLLDLVGCGPGLTPAGDDLLAGYIAGLVLFHRMQETAQQLAAQASPLTTGLSSTLLFHASRGEVPEPVHAFLERGDTLPLMGFGHSSGRFWLLGLTMAGASYRSV
jgi:uncharacterized protein DUF2877